METREGCSLWRCISFRECRRPLALPRRHHIRRNRCQHGENDIRRKHISLWEVIAERAGAPAFELPANADCRLATNDQPRKCPNESISARRSMLLQPGLATGALESAMDDLAEWQLPSRDHRNTQQRRNAPHFGNQYRRRPRMWQRRGTPALCT